MASTNFRVRMAFHTIGMNDRMIDMVFGDVVVNFGVAMGGAVSMRAGGIRMWNCNVCVWHFLKTSL